MHYERKRKNGNPLKQGRIKFNDLKRIEQYINKNGPVFKEQNNRCWIWTGTRYRNNYGNIWFKGKKQLAHRVAYQLWVGNILDGLTIDHLCGVRPCINPSHLKATTIGDNIRRSGLKGMAAINAAKTHCAKGHKYTKENIYLKKNGGRECKACRRLANGIDKRLEYANY